MICRINYREQFCPVVAYAFNAGKKPEIVASALCGLTPREIVAEFESVAGKNTRCKAPVAHFVLSPAKGEILSRQQWERICKNTATEFGAQQWVAVLHRDTECQHISFVLSRIRLDGRAWPTSNDRHRLRAICRSFEDREGLRVTPEHSDAPRVGKEEIEKATRLHKASKSATPIPDRLSIAVAVKAAFQQAATLSEFQERLLRQNISIRWRHDEQGRPIGVSYGRGEASITGKKAGLCCRMLTLHYGEKGTITHEQSRRTEINCGTTPLDAAAGQRNRGADSDRSTGPVQGAGGYPLPIERPGGGSGELSGSDSAAVREVGELVCRAVSGLQIMTRDLEEDGKRFNRDRHQHTKRPENRRNIAR